MEICSGSKTGSALFTDPGSVTGSTLGTGPSLGTFFFRGSRVETFLDFSFKNSFLGGSNFFLDTDFFVFFLDWDLSIFNSFFSTDFFSLSSPVKKDLIDL